MFDYECFGDFHLYDEYCLYWCPYSYRCEEYTYDYDDDWWY